MLSVPPSPPSVNVVQTSPDSVTLRWRVISDGNSPVVKAVINYKMTHGEWLSAQVGDVTIDKVFHQFPAWGFVGLDLECSTILPGCSAMSAEISFA